MSYCKHCGHTISERAKECPSCGEPNKSIILNPKSRGIAVLLALCFGGFGFHRMYVGDVGLGVLYLLFCWTFVPMIIAIMEIIYWLCISNERFTEKYS